MGNRVEDLETQVAELQAAVDGLTEELVEAKERIAQLEDATTVEPAGREPNGTANAEFVPNEPDADAGATQVADDDATVMADSEDPAQTDARGGSEGEADAATDGDAESDADGEDGSSDEDDIIVA